MTDAPDYRILLHNDRVTSMEFVVAALHRVFGLEQDLAVELMREVHTDGLTEVARLPLSAALSAVEQVHQLAAKAGLPLTASLSPVHPLEETLQGSLSGSAMN